MSKHNIAYEIIKEKIISGEFTNKDSISENILVEKLNMSRTPIRAALKNLEHDGFLKILPQKGIIIKEMSIDEAKNLYDLRIAVELFAARKIIYQLTEEDIRNVHAILRRQTEACENGDKKAFLDLDNEFHLYFTNYYKNALIEDILKNFRERFYIISLKALSKPGRMAKALKEHYEILSGYEDRNLDFTLKTLESHIEKGILRTFMD